MCISLEGVAEMADDIQIREDHLSLGRERIATRTQ